MHGQLRIDVRLVNSKVSYDWFVLPSPRPLYFVFLYGFYTSIMQTNLNRPRARCNIHNQLSYMTTLTRCVVSTVCCV